MNIHINYGCCCDTGSFSVLRSYFRKARWIVPGAILLFTPKCPVCFASYFALVTGVGLSLTAANSLRWYLVVFCGGALIFIISRSIIRMANRGTMTTNDRVTCHK
jgi:hypothetical protein